MTCGDAYGSARQDRRCPDIVLKPGANDVRGYPWGDNDEGSGIAGELALRNRQSAGVVEFGDALRLTTVPMQVDGPQKICFCVFGWVSVRFRRYRKFPVRATTIKLDLKLGLLLVSVIVVPPSMAVACMVSSARSISIVAGPPHWNVIVLVAVFGLSAAVRACRRFVPGPISSAEWHSVTVASAQPGGDPINGMSTSGKMARERLALEASAERHRAARPMIVTVFLPTIRRFGLARQSLVLHRR
jgi:hypothetical protein